MEEVCRKTKLGVWRKGVGKRGLGCGGRVPENEAWSVEKGCRKAKLGGWREVAGTRGLWCGGRVPECEAWSVKNSDSKQPSVRLLVPCLPPMRLFLISQSTALPRWSTADAENLTPSAEDQDPAKIRSLL